MMLGDGGSMVGEVRFLRDEWMNWGGFCILVMSKTVR